MTELKKRRAVVTGGASGIGAACARAFSNIGVHVTVMDRDVKGMHALAGEIGADSCELDLDDTEALAGLRIDCDILVNNAGIQHVSPLTEFEPDMFARILRIMLEAPFLLIQAALPGMYERGYGRIVNISSVHGLRASAFKAAYVAAKHGLEGLSKVTALEGAEHGVTSNCICPGYVRTPLLNDQIADQSRLHNVPESEIIQRVLLSASTIKQLVEPADVAALALFLTGENAAMVTGASYTMDGGWTAG